MQWPDLISTGRIFPETGLDNPHFTGMEAFLLNYLKMTVRHRTGIWEKKWLHILKILEIRHLLSIVEILSQS